ncbi:MAG: AI-2E family transporter [Deltaproteobacteria bacterium]|nr:AI-2E family transporter [Deltaproteobacteria bacterium]
MDRAHFFALTAFFSIVLMLYLVYSIVAPFLAPIGWAGVIGILTFPLFKRLRSRLAGRQQTAAAVMTVAVVFVLVLPVIGMVFLLVRETAAAYLFLERLSADGGRHLFENIQAHPLLKPWIERLNAWFGPFTLELDAALFPQMKEIAATVLNYSKAVAKNVLFFVLKLILMVISLFFIYRDGEGFQRQLLSVIPLDESHKRVLVDTVKRVVMAVVYGVFLTCLVQGVLGGIGFWAAGLPSPPLFGAIMAVCALVPVVGTALIWLPAAGYLFLSGEVVKGVGLMLWGALVVSSIDNLIRPFFISGKARLSVLVIAIGGLGGLVSFGLLGVVIGPLVLALFLALFEIYRAEVVTDGSDKG